MTSNEFDAKKIGVFVDTSSLYHKVQRVFSTKLCYDAYYEVCANLGSVIKAVAYGMQQTDEAAGFINCLGLAGFETKFKRPRVLKIGDQKLRLCNWDSVLTLDIINLIDGGGLDVVVLGSTNFDLIPLIKWVRSLGVYVIIFAVDVPRVFQEVADKVIEITENELEEEE
jgi:uncharacterized LabA/DUF88 family protein